MSSLDNARLTLAQAAETIEAAHRAARRAKPAFSVGFLTGQEVDWLPRLTEILSAELPTIEFNVSSLHSPDLADALRDGSIDLGFLRVEPRSGVRYRVIAREPIVVVLPADHRLAAAASVDPRALEGEVLIGFSDVPHVLMDVVDAYLRRHRVAITPSHRIATFGVGLSLVASTGGIALLPTYVEPLLPRTIVSRPLLEEPPVTDLAVGWRTDDTPPVLEAFLSRTDDRRRSGRGPQPGMTEPRGAA